MLAIYAAETLTETEEDWELLNGNMERNEKIDWMDKIINEEVLSKCK